jgi:hypothetical protein
MNELAERLQRSIDAAEARLRALDDRQAAASADGWSKKEIIGHLIDSAANNHQRFVRMQHSPLLSLRSYDQERWVETQGYKGLPWRYILDFWVMYNRHLVHLIRTVDPRALDNKASINGEPHVTLRFIMEDYVAHLEHHLAQAGARPG